MLESGKADGEVVNIGSSDNIEIWTLAMEVHGRLAPELELEYAEHYDADSEHTYADVSKASRLLGYSPEHTIRAGSENLLIGTGKIKSGTIRWLGNHDQVFPVWHRKEE